MTDQRPFGDELPPTFGAGAESETPHEHRNTAERGPTGGEPDEPQGSAEGTASNEVDPALPADEGPRRRRRRGGRGRRRGRAGESERAGDDTGEPTAEASDAAANVDAGESNAAADGPVDSNGGRAEPVEPLPLSEDEPELPELGEYEELSGGAAEGGAEGEDGERRGRRRRRGRRGGRGRRRRADGLPAGAEGAGSVEGAPAEGATEERAPRAAELEAPLDPALEDAPFIAAPAEPREGEGGRRRRRRRGRGGRGGEAERTVEGESVPREGGEAGPGDEREAAVSGEEPREEGEAGRRRRRRRGRGRDREGASGPLAVELIPGEDDELPALAPAAAESQERPAGESRGREKTKEVREPKEEVRAPRPGKKNIILVNAIDREETRVAVVEDGHIVDFQMHVKRHETLVNDIYRGKVVNLEPAIGAAFIDFGQGRNGFLHTSDVLAAYGEKDWSLDKLLTHKIDPEEWDEKSSQPHVGVELSDAHPAASAHERHDDPHAHHDDAGHGHDHAHDTAAHHDHDHDHDHDGEMIEVGSLEAPAPSEHKIESAEPAMDFSFAVDESTAESHADETAGEEAGLEATSGDDRAPSEGGLEADATALVSEPSAPRGGRGRHERRNDRGHGKEGHGKQGHGKQGHGRHRARPRHPISELLQKGQSVVVQVTKDAIGDKGPTLTTYISIPGRYLVLMPSMSRTGVSRKIEDEKERRRLKRILESLEIPAGMGVIVRTAGTGCTKEDLKRDLDYLMLLWDSFGKRLQLGRGPSPLYEESDVAIRTIRDLFNDHTEAVIVDDEKVYNRVREFMQKLIPEKVDRVQLHQGPKPLFHAHSVEQEFERIFSRRIDLASGGSIVFDQAEALVAIDVNSGKTRSDGFDFEDVALRTNLEAVKEIARQIRLRDLGGIIVCDFIDMMRSNSRKKVENALRDAMASDRARSKLGRISQFGLLELTRQRLGPGLSKMLFHNCPRCRGSGRLRTVESRTGAILRRLGSALTLKGFTKVEVRTQPEVVEYMKRNYNQELRDLMLKHEREIELVSVGDQIDDSVLRYLRADGREVRPGGRRKR
jgi:ribonuclease E